jgi:hypothetical protein
MDLAKGFVTSKLDAPRPSLYKHRIICPNCRSVLIFHLHSLTETLTTFSRKCQRCDERFVVQLSVGDHVPTTHSKPAV